VHCGWGDRDRRRSLPEGCDLSYTKRWLCKEKCRVDMLRTARAYEAPAASLRRGVRTSNCSWAAAKNRRIMPEMKHADTKPNCLSVWSDSLHAVRSFHGPTHP